MLILAVNGLSVNDLAGNGALHPLCRVLSCLFVPFRVFSFLFLLFLVFSALWPSCVQCMSFRPLSVGFPGGGCAAPSWFVRGFGGCCDLLCPVGFLVVWNALLFRWRWRRVASLLAVGWCCVLASPFLAVRHWNSDSLALRSEKKSVLDALCRVVLDTQYSV